MRQDDSNRRNSDGSAKRARTRGRQAKLLLGLVSLFVVGLLAAGAFGQVLTGSDTTSGTDTTSVSTTDTGGSTATDTTATTTDTTATDTTTAPSTDTTSTATDTTSTDTTSTDTTTSTTTTSSDGSAPAYSPTISSDQADYSPGSTVTITGSGWPAGDLLKVFTNDSVGQTWTDTGYPQTDANGDFIYTFTLPNYFVASYTTIASDANGLSATTSFTDANLSGATLAVRKSDCLTAASSFTSGDTVCVHSQVTVSTGGTLPDYFVEWVNPSSVLTFTDTHSSVSNGATFNDSHAVATVGTWTVNACKNTGCSGGNLLNTVTFTVAAGLLPQTITFTSTAPGSAVYGGQYTPTATASSGLPVSFGASGACSWDGTKVTMTGVGSCTVTADQAGNGTYSAAPQVSQVFSVGKKQLTVTADDKTITYGQSDPAFTFAYSGGFVAPDTAAGIDTPPTCGVTGAHSDAGSYDIVCSGASDNNYSFAYAKGTLTVQKKQLTVTADDKTITYGQSDPAFTFAYSGGFVAPDTAAGIDTPPTCGVTGAHSDAGSYDIVCSGASDNNYSFAYAKGTLTVQKKQLTVTADDKTITYGQSDPAFTFAYSGGFVAPDTAAGIDTPPTCGVTGAHSDAGSYDIVCSGASDNNYSFAYAKGTLTVQKKQLTVTADDKTITYGQSDPAFTFAYSGGFVAPDTAAGIDTPPTCGVTGAHSDAGSYDIVCSGASDNNYSFAYAKGTLTVQKKQLTVTADALPATATVDHFSKIYGAANPAFTVRYDGFVNGDTAASLGGTLSFTTAATASSPVGSYDVTPGGLTSSNYQITFIKGTLDILYAATGTCLGSPGHVILQPINADGTSVFKQGSTVPAKFRVCDASGNSVGTPGVVTSFRLVKTLSGTAVQVVDEAVDSTTPDTAFRWSSSDQQWIYNMSTKSLSKNVTYFYEITLNDGSVIDFQFGLK